MGDNMNIKSEKLINAILNANGAKINRNDIEKAKKGDISGLTASLDGESRQKLNAALQSKDKAAFDRIVEDRNWKFKEFVNRKKEKNQYNWNELHDLIGECKYFDILSYISQYVHGLSMSNLIIEMDEQNIHGIVSVAVGLIDKFYIYTKEFFAEEYLYILEGLLEPEMRDKILSYFDDQHRPDVEIWNQGVMNKIRGAKMMEASKYC